ncbi:flagellar hook-basal body complex protein, partial [Enterobacter hormaechei]|nr:flagellar hook-basal body complex protein [Enterobacter hormaechei]
TTNRQLDMAITQGGFFRMQDTNGNIFYSRNGQFKMDADRNLINMQGMKLTGYPAVNGEVQQGGAVGPISIPTDMLSAKATTEVKLKANLKSTVEAIDQTEKAFDPTNQDSYHYSTPLPVFDSLGNQHELNVYFVKRADNQWEIKAKDTSVENAEVQELGNVAFDGNGQML